MNLPFYIAKRYLVSKKSHNIINLISWISVSGIAIGTLALVIVLSAFNGLEDLVEDLYTSFDPDIKITAAKGKTFSTSDFPKNKIVNLPEVAFYTEAIEDVALIKYDDKQTVATIKGVEKNFYARSGIDSLLVEGSYLSDTPEEKHLILGYGVADQLSLFLSGKVINWVHIIVPKKGTKKSFTPDAAFRKRMALPSGIFSINPDFDTKYVLADLRFVQDLLQAQGTVSSIELGLKKGADKDHIKQSIQEILGTDYVVKTNYELNELIFKTNQIEKWITFLILAFILIIASFNIIGSLTMLIIDKKKDIWTLYTFGADKGLIQKIFFAEGMLINFLGAAIGMIIGTIICVVQMYIGLLRLDGGVVEFYPVKLLFSDFIFISLIVILIGSIASWVPVRVLTRKHL